MSKARSPLHSWPSPLWLAVAAALYVVGAWQHLGLASIANPQLIFGDDGDGFFNLWVLEHNRQYFFSGFSSWIDGRIFWPSNKMSLFWSDILILPSLPYTLFRALGMEIFIAYRATFFTISILTYSTLLFLFLQLGRWYSSNRKEQANHLPWLSLIFGFILSFSITQISIFLHFQNLCWFGVIAILLGLTGFSITGQRRYLGIAIAFEIALLYSAPYFAIFGVPVFALWGLLHGVRYPDKIILQLRKTWGFWATAALLGSIPVALYHQVPHVEYESFYLYNEMAIRWSHLWTPPKGLLFDILMSQDISSQNIHHESGAYLGVGLELLLAGWVLICIARNKNNFPRLYKSPLLISVCISYLLYRIAREAFPMTMTSYSLAWLTLILFLIGLGCIFKRQTVLSPAGFISSLLLSVILLSFGLALGPNYHFADANINPSIHGLLKMIVPGVGNMRAIGRIAIIGQTCLGLWLFLEYSRLYFQKDSRMWKTGLMVLLISGLSLQFVESWPVQPRINKYTIENFSLNEEDKEFLGKLDGVACVFPTRPWRKNTHAMLYLQSFQNIKLINGYSARSTPLLDQLMESKEKGSEPTASQLEILKKAGCNYIMIWKSKLNRPSFKSLVHDYPLIGETEQMVVLQL